MRELFRTNAQRRLKDEEIAEYRDRTHGWITALQLVRQIAEQKIHGDGAANGLDLSEILKRSERDIFDYFAEEVFSRETTRRSSFCCTLSLLESLPLDTCSMTVPGSAVLQPRCRSSHKRTFFLPSRATRVGRRNIVFIRCSATSCGGGCGPRSGRRAWRRNATASPSISSRKSSGKRRCRFLLDAGNFDRAAEVIAETGSEWIAAGAFISLGLFADSVPARSAGEISLARCCTRPRSRGCAGETDKSSSLLNRAVKLLHEKKDAAGEAEALHSLASLARRRGKYPEAFGCWKEPSGW